MTVTEQDFIDFFICSGCTSMSVAQIAHVVLRDYELTPRDPKPAATVQGLDILGVTKDGKLII